MQLKSSKKLGNKKPDEKSRSDLPKANTIYSSGLLLTKDNVA